MTTSPYAVSARLAVGDVAPAIALRDNAGGDASVEPATHAATVVVFTSGGCPYALAWHDRIQDLARDYAGREVALVQIVSNDPTDRPEDAPEAIARRVAGGEFAGPCLHDPDQVVARAYGATATPEVFVLDRGGVVRYHGAPDGDHDDPSLRAQWVRDALDDVLGGVPVRRESTSPAGCSIKWRVDLLWWDGCPSHDAAYALLDETLDELGRSDVHIRRRRIIRRVDAVTTGFPGSPTFQVGGVDLFPTDAAPGLGCRIYAGSDGRVGPLPTAADLLPRLKDALARPWDLPGWTDFRTAKG